MRDDRQRLVYDVVRRRQRGESIRQIARSKGIARRTVRRILEDMAQRRERGDDALERGSKPRAPRRSKLDPHLELIADLLTEFPSITAQRVYEELLEAGFEGKYTIVKDYVRAVRPRPTKRPADPVHTAPGQQAQVDWSPYNTEIESEPRVEVLSVILHHSRHRYLGMSRDRKQLTLFAHLIDAFEEFGGIPRELVFDSDPGVVARWENNVPILTLGMLDFAAYYGLRVVVTPRADPRSKGSVERVFRYLETNFWNGRRFKTLDEAQQTLRWWTRERANATPNRTTRRIPAQMLEEERPHLIALPTHHYDTSEIGWRIANGFHRIDFDGNRYSVPARYTGHKLCVRATQTTVTIHDLQARQVASHERAARGSGQVIDDPRHRVRKRVDLARVVERYKSLGASAHAFALRVRENKRYGGRELLTILEEQARYSLCDIIAAIEHAHRYRAYDASAVLRILHTRSRPLERRELMALRIRDSIRNELRKSPFTQRELGAYQKLLSPRRQPAERNHEQAESEPEELDES